jgi:hypothetical protein
MRSFDAFAKRCGGSLAHAAESSAVREAARHAEPPMRRIRSAEHRLILASIARQTDLSQIRQLLRSDLDWKRILSAATDLGVAALVYSTLKGVASPELVPPAVIEQLSRLYYQQAALNGRFYADLRKILTACAQAAIPVVVLKGAAIAERTYGNIALRPMRDLDLLVRRKDLEATNHLLHELNYVHDESYRPAEWYRDQHHHLAPYRRPDGHAAVEVHHHIVPPTVPVRIPVEDLWRRAQRASIASTPALVLAPTDVVLHFCLELSCVDRFVGRLRTLCDIAATIERHGEGFDWVLFLQQAADYNAERFVYYPLWLARRFVEADIPAKVLQSLEPTVPWRSFQDSFLKFMIRTAVLQRDGISVIPAWFMIRTCGDLLSGSGPVAAIKALHAVDLLKRAVRRVGRSDH